MVKPDKKTSNFFIACGYLLVAIVILLNYLGKDIFPVQKMSVNAVRPGVPLQKISSGVEMLSRQLNEEKQINQEMRELIKNLQGRPGQKSAESFDKTKTHFKAASIFDMAALPEIRPALFEEITRERENPFDLNKNPFMADKPDGGWAEKVFVDGEVADALRFDSRFPFVVSGASSKFFFSSNY